MTVAELTEQLPYDSFIEMQSHNNKKKHLRFVRVGRQELPSDVANAEVLSYQFMTNLHTDRKDSLLIVVN